MTRIAPPMADPDPVPEPRRLRSLPRPALVGALLLVALGVWLRQPQAELGRPGPDEQFYADYYVKNIATHGLAIYPWLFADYVSFMARPERQLVLPPGRMTFMIHGAALSWLGAPSYLDATRAASSHGTIAFLFIAAVFALRWASVPVALTSLALVVCAPLQRHLSQRALIDGYFAATVLAAVWTLWEASRPGARRSWTLAATAATAAMVLTKENSAFYAAALAAALAWTQWRSTGQSRNFAWAWAALAGGVCIAGGVLLLAAWGPTNLIQAYALNVAKSNHHEYAILTGDGPLQRYPLDVLATNPLVTLCALSALVGVRLPPLTPRGFLSVFLVVSWLAMSAVRYSMNLRYALAWDFPLCLLAALQVDALARAWSDRPARRAWLTAAVTLVLALTSLHAYQVVFRIGKVYDPTPAALTRAWRIFNAPVP